MTQFLHLLLPLHDNSKVELVDLKQFSKGLWYSMEACKAFELSYCWELWAIFDVLLTLFQLSVISRGLLTCEGREGR